MALDERIDTFLDVISKISVIFVIFIKQLFTSFYFRGVLTQCFELFQQQCDLQILQMLILSVSPTFSVADNFL